MQETMWSLVGTILVLGLVNLMMPYVTRKNIFFGVQMPERAKDLPSLKRLRLQYLLVNGGLMLVAVLGLWFLGDHIGERQFNRWSSVMIVAYLILSLGYYYLSLLQARKIRNLHFQGEERNADARMYVSTDFRAPGLIVPNGLIMIVGLLIIALTALLPYFYWEQIPDRIPLHWDFNGTVTNWRDKTPLVFMLLPAFQLLMLPTMILCNYTLKGAKVVIKPKDPKVSIAQNAAYRKAMSYYITAIAFGVLLLFTFLQIAMMLALENFAAMTYVTVGFLVLTIGAIIYIAFKYGQGGERYRVKEKDTSKEEGFIDDDKYWKAGMFYYNPGDPSIFVEKRFGFGITLNFARWQCWAFLIGLLVISVLNLILPGFFF